MVTEKKILFGGFEFPRARGFKYILDEGKSVSDFLFVNEAHDKFSMYFEEGFPIFMVPENSDNDYALFEFKRSGRKIKFFCPEREKNTKTVVWYFYMELLDEKGTCHTLPGQVRVESEDFRTKLVKGKAKFIEILESVTLAKTKVTT